MTVKKELVIKSNSLINMQTDLNLIQLKVFTKIILSTVKEPNAEFYRFTIKDLLNDFNIKGFHYTALKKATAGMIKAVILKTKNGEVQLPLFTKVVYDTGVVDMYLHPDLKPYILDIKERYTKYFFKSITGLNSIYSMRLYELLKQYEFRNNRTFYLEDLRFLLNISIGKYAKYTDFKKRVLLSAQKELQEKTDISFDFTEIREKRRVVKIEFNIISKPKELLESSNSSQTVSNSSKTVLSNTLEQTLKRELFLNNKQIETVLKQFSKEHIERNINYTLQQKNIKNIAGYFIKALELDYWQTLTIQQEQQEKAKTKAIKEQEQQKKQEQQKAQQEREKKLKIEAFINNNEDEIKELLSLFIEKNSYILKSSKIDTSNQDLMLNIIKGKSKEHSHIKSLFYGFISAHIFK